MISILVLSHSVYKFGAQLVALDLILSVFVLHMLSLCLFAKFPKS